MKTANERLKDVRLAMGLNQTEMGELIGLSCGGYSMIERGERNIREKHLLKLEVTNANVQYIREGEGSPVKDRHAEELAQMFGKLPEDKQKLIMSLMDSFLEEKK